MAKKSKFKIPTRSGNRVATLENRYKQEIVRMMDFLYPNEEIQSKYFIRVAVNDVVNPITNKKEYGVIFLYNNTVVSLVEAFHGVDDAVLSFCMEGLAVGRNLCIGFPGFNPRRLKAIVYDRSLDKDQPEEVLVDRGIINAQPFVVSTDELESYEAIFRLHRNRMFPIRIFGPETNPKASLCFEEAKKTLTKIPNRRVPRDML